MNVDAAVGFEERQCLAGIGRGLHLMKKLAHEIAGPLQHGRFVVDDEYREVIDLGSECFEF